MGPGFDHHHQSELEDFSDRRITLLFSGSPSDIPKKPAYRRVRCKRLFGGVKN